MRFFIFLLVWLFPAAAFAADTTLSLAPITNTLIDYAAVAVAGIIGWAVTRITNGLRNFVGIKIDDAQRAVVMGAVERGVNYAFDNLREHIRVKGATTIDVRSLLIKTGLSYVQARVPDALAHFKLRPVDVADMLAAKLQEKGMPDDIAALIKNSARQ